MNGFPSRTPLSRALQALSMLVPLVILPAAGWVLYRQIRTVPLEQVSSALRDASPATLGAGLLLVAVSYLVITSYDGLILRYLRRPLSYARSAATAFVAASISSTVGFSVLSSGPIRLRIYTRLGLTPTEIGGVVACGAFMYFCGFFTLAAMLFTFVPQSLPGPAGPDAFVLRLVGLAFLLGVAGYVVMSLRGRPLKIGGKTVHPPSPPILAAQLAIASIDWLMPPLIFLALLPHHHGVSPLVLVETMLLAQFLGILSNVPAGLGVFDAVALLLVAPVAGTAQVTATLILYRLLYNMLPFSLGLLGLLLFEVTSGAARLARRQGEAGKGS